jgi:hypothetical protein
MRYFLYLLIYIPTQLFSYIVTPILPLFAGIRYGKLSNNNAEGLGIRLPLWLSWFDTPDNALGGDDDWLSAHRTTYWAMVAWLYRNSLYGFNWTVLSIPEGSSEAWHYRRDFKFIRVNLGWMTDNPQNGRLMFLISIRLAK